MAKMKYLTMGALAVVLGGVLVSCSDESDYYGSVVSQKIKAYEEVFTSEFGKIDPNQDWGFGTLAETGSGNAASRRAVTRAIQPSFDFPDDADASKFLADVPEGVEQLTDGNIKKANHWIDETWTGNINISGEGTAENNYQDRTGGTLYIKGNCDFSNRSFYFDGHSELYLIEGATLTLSAQDGMNLQTYCNIYIAKNAKLVTSDELKLNNGLHIFNHGTIEAAKLSTNSDSWLVNGGTVTITGEISVENTESVIENNGTITAADLHTAGSGKFENNSNVTITGSTFVNSNDNTWVNNGQYHTGNFVYNAASDEVINNCRLTVDEQFNVNLGDNPGNGNFKMDAGSGVVTKYFNGGGIWAGTYAGSYNAFTGGPFYIYMGAGSVFKVTDTATMNATEPNYGIYGPEEGKYAVFEAKNIVKGAENQGFEVTYGGNLAVSAENHFAQGTDGADNHPFIDFKGNAKVYAPGFEDGSPAIKITPTACNPGFPNGNTVIPETDELPIIDVEYEEGWTQIDTVKQYYETTQLIQQGRVFCEDLGQVSSNDLDFNDVVFDAYIYKTKTKLIRTIYRDGELDESETQEEVVDEKYHAHIILLAAGGTLQLTVAGQEVHNAFNKTPVTTIVNTITGDVDSYGNNYNQTPYNPVDLGDFDGYSSIAAIPIVVNYGTEVLELNANYGQAPHKILVPIGTKWTRERVKIRDTYEQFKDYVNNSDVKFWDGPVISSNLYILESDTYEELSMEESEPVLIKTERETTKISNGETVSGGYPEGGVVLSRKK